MSSLFSSPQLYRNMNHETYRPEETQFDPDMAVEDGTVTSPVGSGAMEEKEKQWGLDDKEEKHSAKSKTGKGKGKGKAKKGSAPSSDVDDDAPAGKLGGKDKGRRSRSPSPSAASARGGSGSALSSGPTLTVQSASDSVFSQLLLESILAQKSVPDFVGGLPDKRGSLLVRFPTTLLGRSWKKRYFTLHGDCLFFHEEQAAIHPPLGSESMGDSVNSTKLGGQQGVNYDKCKKIDIANFWIIQQEGKEGPLPSAGNSFTPTLTSLGEKVYGLGQPIPVSTEEPATGPAGADDSAREDMAPQTPHGPASSTLSSKLDDLFSKNKSNPHIGELPRKSGDSPRGAGSRRGSRDEGPVVRGRRRSSLVLDGSGRSSILLIPREKGSDDAVELTGLNEGSAADLPVLHEWVVALNARIALLNFLHSPLNGSAMNRGGREILAFLTDAQSTHLRIANKFTDLSPVLRHFREALSHRRDVQLLSFTNCAMTDEAVGALADILAAAPDMSVECMDLSGNLITAASMGKLHRALSKNRKVKQLILDHNQLGDEGVRVLMHGEEALTPASAPVPASTAAAGSDAAADATPPSGSAGLPPSLWSSSLSLDSLSLAHNQLSDKGVSTLTSAILASLQREYGEGAERPDADALASGHRFLSLNLAGNHMTDQGMSTLAEFLLANPRVEQLNVASNFVTDASAAKLASALSSERCGVASLDLRHNQLTSVGANVILDGIESNPRRRSIHVDLSGNTGLDEGVLQKLLSIKAKGTGPAAMASTDGEPGKWGVRITSLAFDVYDGEDGGSVAAGSVPSSPRAGLNGSAGSSSRLGVPAGVSVSSSMSSSQQDVLSLFSPNTAESVGHQYPTYSSAKVAPAAAAGSSSANVSSANSSASNTPTSSRKKQSAKARRDRKRASINDPSAPKIAISATPIRGAGAGRVSITPLHPPPAHEDPAGSPVAVAGSGSLDAGASTPSGPTPVAREPIQAPPPSALAEKDDEEEHPQELLPAQMGQRKPKGLINS